MLSDIEEPGQTVEIHGHGTRERLEGDFTWIDRLRQPTPGILLEHAPQQVDTGADFQINGRLIGAAGTDSLILFRDDDQIQRQLPEADGSFTFTDRLRVAGPALYHIEAATADTLLRESLHIRATDPGLLSIAVALYSPSFEMTHLAEWLGNNGHRLAMRTRVGNDRFRFDEINSPPADAAELNENLTSFDLLILDPREVTEYSARQVQSVAQAVESGLDVLLLPPSENRESEWEQAMTSISGESIELNALSRIEERQWNPEFVSSLTGGGVQNARLSVLNYTYDGLSDATQTPGLFENREPVILRIPSGNGSVSSHLFYQTYSWKLRGDMNLYSEFWAGHLEETVTIESPFVEVSSDIPGVGNRLIITTSATQLTVTHPAQTIEWEIPLVAGAEHPGVSYGYFWPRSAGWHLAEAGESRRWFYVYDSARTFTEKYNRFRSTRSEIQALSSQLIEESDPAEHSFSARWWLIVFLVLQVILWAERKVVG